jgi:hypothetical protein
MKAKVWNDGNETYREVFKGNEIVIPAKQFIEMEFTEANVFRGTFTPIVRDGSGKDLRPKAIRVEKILESAAEEKVEYVCTKDGSKWPNQEALDNHIAKNYSELLDDEGKEKLKKKK